jgi:hypothetical protein
MAAEASEDDGFRRSQAWLIRARVAHALGDITSARADFAAHFAAPGLVGFRERPEFSEPIRHHLDLGEFEVARELCEKGRQRARVRTEDWLLAEYDAWLARLALAERTDPGRHIESLRSWTARTGDMALIIEAHLLTARHFLASGAAQTALGEAETGLLHAVSCGYVLLRIELLVALARIRLAWPDPPTAVQAAREALDLATHPDCLYAWGEADAAQVWGEAYFANHEPALAHRALTQALAVRRRIEHPGGAETERWLKMVP